MNLHLFGLRRLKKKTSVFSLEKFIYSGFINDSINGELILFC